MPKAVNAPFYRATGNSCCHERGIADKKGAMSVLRLSFKRAFYCGLQASRLSSGRLADAIGGGGIGCDAWRCRFACVRASDSFPEEG